MTILVTGACGFIGSHLCEALQKSNAQTVIGIDHLVPYPGSNLKEENLKTIQNLPNTKFLNTELSNVEEVDKIFSENDIELVIHLAAHAGVRPSLENPVKYSQNNIEVTIKLLEAMKKYSCKKIAFASSSSIYGNIKEIPFQEDFHINSMISTYAITKHTCENILDMYHTLYQFDVLKLRFFTVYGPRQRPDLAIHKFMKLIMEDKQITLFGKGKLSRDYTYVDDTVSGILGAVNYLRNKTNINEIINLGNSSPVSLHELIETISKVLNRKPNISFEPTPPGDVDITYANVSKAKKLLDYDPNTSLEKGIQEFYNWMKEFYNYDN